MPNTMTIWNKVDRSGDVMTGNLNLGLNSLILNDGVKGGRLRGDPAAADQLEIRDMANANPAGLKSGNIYPAAILLLGTNPIIFGDTTDGAKLKAMTGQGSKLFIRNYGDSFDGYLNFAGGQMTDHLLVTAGKLVDGRDISSMVRAKCKIATYTGDGADNRDINIGIDLTAKTNVWIMVGDTNGAAVDRLFRPEIGQGDATYPFTDGGPVANQIQALTATGFQLGSDSKVNGSGIPYCAIVHYEEP